MVHNDTALFFNKSINFFIGVVDREDWTQEKIAEVVEHVCRENGNKFYIPGTTMGGVGSAYPGVYEAVTAEINKMSKIMFK